jgi:hypothetical protein
MSHYFEARLCHVEEPHILDGILMQSFCAEVDCEEEGHILFELLEDQVGMLDNIENGALIFITAEEAEGYVACNPEDDFNSSRFLVSNITFERKGEWTGKIPWIPWIPWWPKRKNNQQCLRKGLKPNKDEE